jgi:hypothetical protein
MNAFRECVVQALIHCWLYPIQLFILKHRRQVTLTLSFGCIIVFSVYWEWSLSSKFLFRAVSAPICLPATSGLLSSNYRDSSSRNRSSEDDNRSSSSLSWNKHTACWVLWVLPTNVSVRTITRRLLPRTGSNNSCTDSSDSFMPEYGFEHCCTTLTFPFLANSFLNRHRLFISLSSFSLVHKN